MQKKTKSVATKAKKGKKSDFVLDLGSLAKNQGSEKDLHVPQSTKHLTDEAQMSEEQAGEAHTSEVQAGESEEQGGQAQTSKKPDGQSQTREEQGCQSQTTKVQACQPQRRKEPKLDGNNLPTNLFPGTHYQRPLIPLSFSSSFGDDSHKMLIRLTSPKKVHVHAIIIIYCMKPYNIKGTARALYPVHVERAQYGQ